MVRDFSDAARFKLKETIRQINDEQGTSSKWWEQNISYDGSIASYLDVLDAYHKMIMTKNDTTEAEIDKIFSDVFDVDVSYYGKSTFSYELVQDQLGIIEALCEAINPDAGNFNASDIGRLISEHVSENMQQKILNYYLDKLRIIIGYDENGNPIYDYDWDYIHEIMERDPETVPPALYLALIEVFNDMSIDEKELFIEASYLIEDNGTTCWYEISPVFVALALIYQVLVNNMEVSLADLTDRNNDIHEYYFNCALLLQIVMLMPIIWMNARPIESYPVDIKITEWNPEDEKDERMPWDYVISNNGADMGSEFITAFRIMHFRDNLDGILDDNAIAILNSRMPDDITSKFEEETYKIILDKILDLIDIINPFGMLEFIEDAGENAQAINDYTTIINLLNDGNISRALYFGASITVLPNGSYVINSAYIDVEKLTIAFQAYEQYLIENNKPPFGYIANDVANGILDGTMDPTVIQQYVKWFCNQSGESYISDYTSSLS